MTALAPVLRNACAVTAAGDTAMPARTADGAVRLWGCGGTPLRQALG